MKTLFRLALVVGVLYVLTPCACEEISKALISASPSSNHDCCGGKTGTPSLHKTMDQKAFLGEVVQVLPPVVVVLIDLPHPSLTVSGFIASARPIDTGPPLPSFNRPLLI